MLCHSLTQVVVLRNAHSHHPQQNVFASPHQFLPLKLNSGKHSKRKESHHQRVSVDYSVCFKISDPPSY